MSSVIISNLNQVINNARERLHNKIDGKTSTFEIVSNGTVGGTFMYVNGILLNCIMEFSVQASVENGFTVNMVALTDKFDFNGKLLTKDLVLEFDKQNRGE